MTQVEIIERLIAEDRAERLSHKAEISSLVNKMLDSVQSSMNQKKFVDYSMCAAEATQDLVDFVGNATRDGYEPFGNPFVNNEGIVYQAMIKYED